MIDCAEVISSYSGIDCAVVNKYYESEYKLFSFNYFYIRLRTS